MMLGVIKVSHVRKENYYTPNGLRKSLIYMELPGSEAAAGFHIEI